MRLNKTVLILFLLLPARVIPCGLCREDDRSAVYSYEAAKKVEANPKRLEFTVLKVKGALPEEVADRLTRWLQKRKGVDPETVKVSSVQKSVGLVFQKRFSKEDLLSSLERNFPNLEFRILPHDHP